MVSNHASVPEPLLVLLRDVSPLALEAWSKGRRHLAHRCRHLALRSEGLLLWAI